MPWQGGELWEEKCIFMWLLSTITLQSDLRPARFIIGRQLQQNFKCESAEEPRNSFRYGLPFYYFTPFQNYVWQKSMERLTRLWVLWRSKNPSPWLVLWVWILSVLSAPGFSEDCGPVMEISYRILDKIYLSETWTATTYSNFYDIFISISIDDIIDIIWLMT